jgi:uncharacterized protein with von Willebrand factor type A (vWA) domain
MFVIEEQPSSSSSLLERVVQFSQHLHRAGIPVNPSNLIDLCRSFEFVDIGCREDFYAAARTTLVSNHNDLEAFDQIFTAFWDSNEPEHLAVPNLDQDSDVVEDENAPAATVQQQKEEMIEQESDEDDDRESEEEFSELSYSPDEVLMRRDLGSLSDEEVQQARRIIKELVDVIANYQSRRYKPDNKKKKLDLRRMMRSNVLTDDLGVFFKYRARRRKKNKLALLCDVSGSMENYSRFLIQFIYALRAEIPDTEVAVFSTRVSVITEMLKAKTVEESLSRVSEKVQDWAGGTNLGASLREFNDCYAESMLHSRSVVIILSDGWDRGDAYLMREELEHLQRRAHKIIWLNPLLGSEGYQPLCRGMQTALPYLDFFLPAHNLASLAGLAKTLKNVWR